MITNETQLQQAIEQIGRMARALDVLYAEVLPKSRQQFALMAEGPLEEVQRLEQIISAYIDQTLDTPEEAVSAVDSAAA